MERVYLVSKYDSKTENNCLHRRRNPSVVNEPTSVGIEPVSSFSAIKILRKEKLEGDVRSIELVICFYKMINKKQSLTQKKCRKIR